MHCLFVNVDVSVRVRAVQQTLKVEGGFAGVRAWSAFVNVRAMNARKMKGESQREVNASHARIEAGAEAVAQCKKAACAVDGARAQSCARLFPLEKFERKLAMRRWRWCARAELLRSQKKADQVVAVLVVDLAICLDWELQGRVRNVTAKFLQAQRLHAMTKTGILHR